MVKGIYYKKFIHGWPNYVKNVNEKARQTKSEAICQRLSVAESRVQCFYIAWLAMIKTYHLAL